MTARDVLESLDLDGVPIRDSFSLVRQSERTLTCTVMADAWQESDHISLDDPGSVDQYYFPDESVIVIDLDSGGE